MKNRIAAVLMSICVAASMCACGSGTAQQAQPAEKAQEGAEDAAETEAEESASPDDAAEAVSQVQEAEEEAAPGGEEEALSEENASDVIPSIAFLNYNRMEEEGEDLKTIASCSYDTPQLIEDAAIAYPDLNKTLTADSARITEQYEEYYEEIKEASRSAYETMDNTEDFPAGEIRGRMEVVRCDRSVLSFCDTRSIYNTGAAHGMLGFDGYNYDTASGEPIELTDVFADLKAMEEAIKDNLVSTATNDKIPEEDAMMEFAFENDYGDLDWVIDRNGVRFLFAPSDIAPYALGTIEARISFDANPSLFTGKYGKAEGGYVQKLNPYDLYTVDLNGDGSEETLSVNGIEGEEEGSYYYTGLEVHVGDETHTKEDTFYSLTPYLLHTEDGRNYVYVITGGDNDYQTLTVFEIKDNVISTVGVMGETGVGSLYLDENPDGEEFDIEKTCIEYFPMVDPAHFALSKRMALMSSYSGMRYYMVGGDGMPFPLEDQYVIRTGIQLTSKVPLKAEEVDEISGEGTGTEVEIPAGSKCTFSQTNGIDTVDLQVEDGPLVRFHVETSVPQMVNGVELEEAFDGIAFGG